MSKITKLAKSLVLLGSCGLAFTASQVHADALTNFDFAKHSALINANQNKTLGATAIDEGFAKLGYADNFIKLINATRLESNLDTKWNNIEQLHVDLAYLAAGWKLGSAQQKQFAEFVQKYKSLDDSQKQAVHQEISRVFNQGLEGQNLSAYEYNSRINRDLQGLNTQNSDPAVSQTLVLAQKVFTDYAKVVSANSNTVLARIPFALLDVIEHKYTMPSKGFKQFDGKTAVSLNFQEVARGYYRFLGSVKYNVANWNKMRFNPEINSMSKALGYSHNLTNLIYKDYQYHQIMVNHSNGKTMKLFDVIDRMKPEAREEYYANHFEILEQLANIKYGSEEYKTIENYRKTYFSANSPRYKVSWGLVSPATIAKFALRDNAEGMIDQKSLDFALDAVPSMSTPAVVENLDTVLKAVHDYYNVAQILQRSIPAKEYAYMEKLYYNKLIGDLLPNVDNHETASIKPSAQWSNDGYDLYDSTYGLDFFWQFAVPAYELTHK